MVSVLLCRLTTSLFFLSVVIASQLINPVVAGEPETITVEITTHLGDQQAFVEGDVISFLLSLDRDAYVYLFYEDASASNLSDFPKYAKPYTFLPKGLFYADSAVTDRFSI